MKNLQILSASKRKALATLAAGAAIGALAVLAIPNAGAAGSNAVNPATTATCKTGQKVPAGQFGTQDAKYCYTYREAPIYNSDSQVIGKMYKGVNWVICASHGRTPNPAVGEQTNNFWLYTLGDTGGWGWMPSTYVAEGNSNEIPPGVPDCANLVY